MRGIPLSASRHRGGERRLMTASIVRTEIMASVIVCAWDARARWRGWLRVGGRGAALRHAALGTEHASMVRSAISALLCVR